MANRRYLRRAVLTLLVAGCLLPVAIAGAYRGLGGITNHAMQWIPGNIPQRDRFDWYSTHFEHPDPIVVSWEGCTIDDPRLDAFARGLSAHVGEEGASDAAFFLKVITGREVLEELTSPPLDLRRSTAVRRLRESLIGPDGRATCAVAILSQGAADRCGAALDVIYRVAAEECGLDRPEVRVGGPAVESVEIDRASVASLYANVLPSAVAVLLVAWPCLRSLWMTVLICTSAFFCECFALALVYYTGATMTGLLVVMPALIFVVYVSGAVHLINYHTESLQEVGPHDAPQLAVAIGRFPCAVAMLTTAIGVASLSASSIAPVVVFARYAAIGIALSLAVLLLVMPGAMVVRSRLLSARRPAPAAKPRVRRPADILWSRLARGVARRHRAIVVGFCLLLAVCFVGLRRLDATMDLNDFFRGESKVVSDHAWLEKKIGPLLPVEVVVEIDGPATRTMHDKLALVSEVERAIRAMPSAGGTMSAATFAPPLTAPRGLRDFARWRVEERQLAARRDDFVDARFLANDGASELWRVTARVPALSERDYRENLLALRAVVDGALERQREAMGTLNVTYTGMLPLIVESRERLLTDLVLSFGLALLVIALVLTIALRSVGLGLLSLVPNLFPAVTVFGAMGWLGTQIDIGSMMTASVGLGIAVDDTVHYLTWFRRYSADGHLPDRAILLSYRRCAGAMIRTSLICGAGLIVFVTSPLVPAAQFALLICILFLAALVGDLILLPALLCSSLTRRLVVRADGEPAEGPPRDAAPLASPRDGRP